MVDLNSQWDRAEKGQSMVEFAISAIVILLMLVAIADFGRAFFTYLSLRDAAQEGAIYGAICPLNYTSIINRVKQTSNQPVNLNTDPNVSITCDFMGDLDEDGYLEMESETFACDDSSYEIRPGYGIRLRVIYDDFTVTTPLLGSIIGQTLTLRAEVTDTVLRVVDSTEATCQ
jgi:hypothetical protein